jgi:hypothetical protein
MSESIRAGAKKWPEMPFVKWVDPAETLHGVKAGISRDNRGDAGDEARRGVDAIDRPELGRYFEGQRLSEDVIRHRENGSE